MENITNREVVEQVLRALGEQLGAAEESYELVVVGGSGLLILGVIERSTRDVDLVALRVGSELEKPDPLPEILRDARDRVARDFSLPDQWLNPGPADLLDFEFASRFDQIHFKLYAAVDAGPGKHSQDLEALEPTPKELLLAARWTCTHDPSSGFKEVLRRVLAHYGVDDADI
jgi:hypothetical protein